MAITPIALIVLTILAALVIPTYLGRARIRACEQRGGRWVAGQGCQARRVENP